MPQTGSTFCPLNTQRLSLPALYWLDHQSSAQLLDGISRKGQVIDQVFRGTCGAIALGAMALRVWRRRRQAAGGRNITPLYM